MPFFLGFNLMKKQCEIIWVLRLLNSRTRMTLKSSIVILQALETTAASLTSVASATSLASTASTALFSQKTSWSQWSDHQWHQNDQYWSFFVEWFIKNLNFHWYMALFLLEAVEASLCYFFENWWMKHSNAITSGIHRYLQTKSKLHISICQSQFKRNISKWDTL